jgi:hypothetical protein
MNKKRVVPIVIAVFLIFLVFIQMGFNVKDSPKSSSPDVFVGVDVAYGGADNVKRLVDEVKSYSNLIILGSTEITMNVTQLQEVSKYVVDNGLYLVIFSHFAMDSSVAQWIYSAKQNWGAKFLGVYAYDELGGRQLDHDEAYLRVKEAANYSDAANKFVSSVNDSLTHFMPYYMMTGDQSLLTSDYALYWFDYKAGYNMVLTEFGWNYSRQLAIALDRGAATVRNKDWGAIIDWTYTDPPYIESGTQLFNDMKLAYDNGAKYIIVFDSNVNHTESILQEEHLTALSQFWQYTKNHPRSNNRVNDRVAYVLLKDYGYGFRGPDDKIWGLWQADNSTYQLINDVGNLLQEYGNKLDIIYDDELDSANTSMYNQVTFWNGTAPREHS